MYEVDASSEDLRRAGVPIKLRGQSFSILILLLEHAGELVTREDLRKALWPADTFVDFDHSLNAAVRRLREALGDTADKPLYIETIPKRGYRFVAPVSLRADPPVETSAFSPRGGGVSVSRDPLRPATVQRHRVLLAVGVLGAILLSAGSVAILRYGHVRFPGTSGVRPVSNFRITPITSSLGSVVHPAITRDGREVAYAWNGPDRGAHRDIYWQLIGSSNKPMRLTYLKSGWAGHPAWSPDGSVIAFTWCAGGQDGVYIVPVTGGPERKLTSVGCQFNETEPLAWFADGTRMLMIDRCSAEGPFGLVVFSLETGEKKCLAESRQSGYPREYKYSLSPDESTVAFNPSNETPDCAIFTVAISGGAPHRIAKDDHPCGDLMWTPDGSSVVFESQRATPSWSLWRIPAAGGQILPESVYPELGSYSGDGRSFVYAESGISDPAAIWRLDLSAAGGRVVSNRKVISTQFGDMDAQPSPDGTRVAWMSRRSGPAEIWVSDAMGGSPLQLTRRNQYCGSPRWSPDSKWIAFDCDTPDGARLFIIDAEGRNQRGISRGPYHNIVPSWSRDGKSIYFVSNRSGRDEVWKQVLETGKELQLTTHGGFNPFESYDRKTVYFSKFDEAGIWSVPSDGGAESLVVEGKPQIMYWGQWAVTRTGIYVLNADAAPKGRIEFFDFATRRSWPVLDFELRPVYLHPSISATADGVTVYYSMWDWQSVIQLMEFQQ